MVLLCICRIRRHTGKSGTINEVEYNQNIRSSPALGHRPFVALKTSKLRDLILEKMHCKVAIVKCHFTVTFRH